MSPDAQGSPGSTTYTALMSPVSTPPHAYTLHHTTRPPRPWPAWGPPSSWSPFPPSPPLFSSFLRIQPKLIPLGLSPHALLIKPEGLGLVGLGELLVGGGVEQRVELLLVLDLATNKKHNTRTYKETQTTAPGSKALIRPDVFVCSSERTRNLVNQPPLSAALFTVPGSSTSSCDKPDTTRTTIRDRTLTTLACHSTDRQKRPNRPQTRNPTPIWSWPDSSAPKHPCLRVMYCVCSV